MVRQWITKGKIDVANSFLERMNAGLAKELAETTGVGANSIIIDSDTASALIRDADPIEKAKTDPDDLARVAEIKKSLPPGTKLRVGNVTVGETGGALKLKGVPIEVLRDSADYGKVPYALDKLKVGQGKGIADRALIADAFFAKTEPGVTPKAPYFG